MPQKPLNQLTDEEYYQLCEDAWWDSRYPVETESPKERTASELAFMGFGTYEKLMKDES